MSLKFVSKVKYYFFLSVGDDNAKYFDAVGMIVGCPLVLLIAGLFSRVA